MLATFVNSEDEDEKYGTYKMEQLPDPGEIIGIYLPGNTKEPTACMVVSREYIYKSPHNWPEITIYINPSAGM